MPSCDVGSYPEGWGTLLNRKGTTWRGLHDALKQSVHDAESAIAVMLSRPSTIKRPVVVAGASLVIGVDADGSARLALAALRLTAPSQQRYNGYSFLSQPLFNRAHGCFVSEVE